MILYWYPTFFFSFPIFLCSHIDGHSKEDLAKFGYIKYMKVEKFKNPTIIWLPWWNPLYKSGNFRIFSLKIWKIWAIFSIKIEILCVGWNQFCFGHQLVKIPTRRTLPPDLYTYGGNKSISPWLGYLFFFQLWSLGILLHVGNMLALIV